MDMAFSILTSEVAADMSCVAFVLGVECLLLSLATVTIHAGIEMKYIDGSRSVSVP